MSAADEDTELRDLLVQTLDKNGVLGKIKAELRASIFLALEAQEQNKTQNPLKNTNLQKFVATGDGKMCIGIINQFLEHFYLDYTSAVFGPEANVNDTIPSENEISHQLSLQSSSGKVPLLSQMVESLKSQNSSPHGLDSSQILFLRSKFDSYDDNHCGSIDQKDVVSVITLACPLFHPEMLEKFVSEEFKNKYTSNVTFDSFINLFKKLYEMCNSITTVGIQSNIENKSSANSFYMKQTTPFHQVPASPTPISGSRQDGGNTDSGGIPSAYLMPTTTPRQDNNSKMDTGYDDFFDSPSGRKSATELNKDNVRGRGELPDGYTDTPAISPDTSRTGDDWPNKKLKTEKPQSQQYEDDFNSEQSISEDIQDMGDDLLQSSDKDESLDLTEDRTVSEIPHADYMEDIRHG